MASNQLIVVSNLPSRSVPLGDMGHVVQVPTIRPTNQTANEMRPAVQGGTRAEIPEPSSIQHQGRDEAFATVLEVVQVKPADIFPPNKIATRCHLCRGVVSRGTGYKHHNLGRHYSLCAKCQAGQGLPLREMEARDPSWVPFASSEGATTGEPITPGGNTGVQIP